MSESYVQPAAQVPRWLIWVGSVAIVFHLAAIGVNALAVPSGPWADNSGAPIGPPYLASRLNEMIGADYLTQLRLGLVYHSHANKNPAWPGVRLEFHLKDEDGKEIRTIVIPDETANSAVQHRQSMLTMVFAEDRPIMARQSEMIPAPGQTVPVYDVWQRDGKQWRIVKIDENALPRGEPAFGPTEAMYVLANSYSRHLCAGSGAAKVELIRRRQDPIRPRVLNEDVSPREFDEVVSNFGEFPR